MTTFDDIILDAEASDSGDEFGSELVAIELVVLGLAGTTVTDDGAGGVQAIDGAGDVLRELRDAGVKIALTTGLPGGSYGALLDELGWRDLVDVTLSPADALRGRPFPDVPLTALLRTSVSRVDAVVVVGDTAGDMVSGAAAGAGLIVGVLTGAHDAPALTEAGADEVLDSIADLPALLGLR